MEIKDVAAASLSNIITSNVFKRALSKAGNKTYQTGHEVGFFIMKKYGSNYFGVPWIKEGGCASISHISLNNNLYEAKSAEMQELMIDTYPLFDIHFHPDFTGPIIPSEADLKGIHGGYFSEQHVGEKYEVHTIFGIAQIDNHRNIEMLTIQPLMPFCPGDDEEGMVERLISKKTTDAIAQELRSSNGYITEVLHFHKWEIIEADLPKLDKFAFTPKLICS